MKIGENEEIVVRGPHIFFRLLNRSEETARVLQDGWFHTGDQGEVNVRGNWRISGRIKNLIILNSGHNIAPEPIEDKIASAAVGAASRDRRKWRGYLCPLVSGAIETAAVQSALDAVNPELPHYRQVRKSSDFGDIFSPENGLLTVNGKLRATPSMRDMLGNQCHVRFEGAREAASKQHSEK